MDVSLYIYFIMVLGILLLAWMIYLVISKITLKKRVREEILRQFHAQEYEDALKFEYRGYTMLATFRPDIKISIFHNLNIENIDVRVPKGMNLTPMFLIIKIRRGEEIGEKVEEAVNFLNSIPTQ